MKKKLISVVAIGALLAGGVALLAGCNGGNNGGGDGTSQKTAGKFSVSYTESEDYEVNGLQAEYAPGETVTFTVTVKNSAKEISSVRVNNARISPNDNGSYSFEMPEEDVTLRITLSDKVAPTLAASYSGRTVVGEKLTISATIDEVSISNFNVEAKTGANLVTVNGKEVTLNAAGSVVLEITATQGEYNLSASLSFDISAGEASYGQNIAYDTHQPTAGIESATKANRGTILTCGVDGGSVASLNYNAAKDEYTMAYSNGWAFSSVQLFYDLPYGEAGDIYHFAWDVESDKAGQMTISGHAVNVKAGSNYFNFDITQGVGALISIQFGVNNESNLEGEILKFSPFRLYDADATHKYHHVTFANGSDVIKDIYVRDGKTVEAPVVNSSDTQSFTGFYEGDTKLLSNDLITADHTYVARFTELTPENFKFFTIFLTHRNWFIEIYRRR